MRASKIILAPCVENELWAIWTFISQHNPDAADFVVESVYATFDSLARSPGIGKLRPFKNPKLEGIRSWPVSGFHNYLIFYKVIPGGIQIFHVFHGARSVEALFGE